MFSASGRSVNLSGYMRCALFAALISIGGFIKVYFYTLPLTLQTFFISCCALTLGKRLGSMSVLLYMFMGLAGIPVFTEGGGIFYVLKPSFGYIVGFFFGAYITGLVAEKLSVRSVMNFFVASAAGLAVIYIFGMIYYYFLSNFYLGNYVGLWKMIVYFCLIFVPGDLVCCLAAAYVSEKIYPRIGIGRQRF